MAELFKLSDEDQAFFLEIFLENQRLMFKYARQYATKDQDAEELVHDVIVKLIKHIEKLREIHKDSRDKIPGYIVRTIQREAINAGIHQAVVDKHIQPEDEKNPIDSYADDSDAVENAVLRKERRDAIHKLWPKLSPEEQNLIHLKYYFQYSDRDAGAKMGIEEGLVRQRKFRLLKKLRKMIAKGGLEDEARE